MGSSRDAMMQKAKALQAQYEICKDQAYGDPDYQTYFKMCHELVDFIVEEHEQGNLDGNDLFHLPLDVEELFGIYRNPEKLAHIEQRLEVIQKDIKAYINS